ncbi:MAG: signal recognition particle-docking protein FtsY [Clostridia bacterium]|nr:signal recognition particle-docking protein FtsY [Clostridia bacterium]
MGFFDKLKKGLSKTSGSIAEKVNSVFKFASGIDADFYEELEEALIMADMGAFTASHIIEELKKKVKAEKLKETDEVKTALSEVIADILTQKDASMNLSTTPSVILVIGVNGVGKTTSIGKLASHYKSMGKNVIMAAADTFRAAAIDQIDVWAKRVGCDIIKHQENSDPASVVFDACKAAKARGADILICDTAGRLHNKKNLMDELQKIGRVIDRELSGCSKEVLLVLDATTGQNALSQAKLFSEVADITGLVLTKLDGTAKGGVIVPIMLEQSLPVKFVGVGEGIDDLQEFEPSDFAKALLEAEE